MIHNDNINTIILKHSESNYSANDVRRGKVSQGDSFIDQYESGEVKRWSINDEAAALAELAKHKCTYDYRNGTVWADEWALEFFEADEDGEFVMGADEEYAVAEFDGDSFYTPSLDGVKLVLVETEAE